MSSIQPAKLAAYQDTEYVVSGPSGPFTLRIGQVSPELQALYAETGQASALFITAFNPEGTWQADDLNEMAHEAFRNGLGSLPGLAFEGEGRGTAGNAGWPPEKSFLVIGVDRQDSARLGSEFRQDAVVWAGADSVPELLILR